MASYVATLWELEGVDLFDLAAQQPPFRSLTFEAASRRMSMAAALLPAVVRTLNDRHPGLTLHVTLMSRPITEEARRLRDREVEFIIARGVFAVPEDDLDVELLFEEPLLLIAGAASRWVADPPRGLADLLATPWVLYPPGEPPGTLVDEASLRDETCLLLPPGT